MTDSLAVEMFRKVGAHAEFLKLPETRKLFRAEQHLPGKVIDRGSLRSWEECGKQDSFARAKQRVNELVASYRRPVLQPKVEQELRRIVEEQARREGMEHLPEL